MIPEVFPMLQRRPSSIATMLGIVVLVAVVLVLLMQPGRTPVQPADFAALSADASYTAKSSSTGDGFTLTVNLDDPDSAAGQTVYQGSYGSIVLEAVTDVSETGCTLQFASSGGQDADGKVCLVSGALPGEDGLLTAEVSALPYRLAYRIRDGSRFYQHRKYFFPPPDGGELRRCRHARECIPSGNADAAQSAADRLYGIEIKFPFSCTMQQQKPPVRTH